MQALTEYHYVLLFPARLVLVNRVSEAAVQEIQLGGRSSPPFAGTPVGLAVDDAASSVFLFTSAPLCPFSRPLSLMCLTCIEACAGQLHM